VIEMHRALKKGPAQAGPFSVGPPFAGESPYHELRNGLIVRWIDTPG
jgi:hypothetical protein